MYAIKLDEQTQAKPNNWLSRYIWNGKPVSNYKLISTSRIGHVLFASKTTLEKTKFRYNENDNQALCLSKGDQIVNITSFENFKSDALQQAMKEDDTSDPAIIVCDLVS